jgi:hypothetical protein
MIKNGERRHYTLSGAKILTTNVVREAAMAGSTSIRINQELYEQAKQDAAIEHRSIAGQIEFWARVGRAALDNPDLPVGFIAESLASLAEPREYAQPFVPRSGRSK